jgi:hypothetical protein
VLLDGDANAALLGILTEDAILGHAALVSLSILKFASCTDRKLVRGRSPAFGDIGVLFSGVGNEIPARYDLMPCYDLGFRNLVLIDRGYDPVTTGYGYETVDTLGKVNAMLGL